jgi:mRNA interferase YafQ
MRKIDRQGQFRRDYKREAKGPYRALLDTELADVVIALANDQLLETRYRDHALCGNWAGYRECHLKPDLLLIYAKPDAVTLQLVRLGSHSELFG